MENTWNIDQQHSAVGFSVRHMVISKVRGRFRDFTATLKLDEADLTRSSLDVHIAVASIDTGVADRDAHLRSADFFNAEQYPELRYVSRRIEAVSPGAYRVVGDLTIRDVTREVVLEVEHGGMATDPWGNYRAGFVARATIDRTDFGLTWNQVLEAGGVLVGEKVTIELELEAIRAARAA